MAHVRRLSAAAAAAILLAAGNAAGPARAGELPAGALARLGTGGTRHGWRLAEIAAEPGGRSLVAFGGDLDWTIRLLDPLAATSIREAGCTPPETGMIARSALAATFSPDRKMLATGGFGGKLAVWDSAGGKLVADIPIGVDGIVSAIAVGPGASTLAAGTTEGTVILLGRGSGRALQLPGHAAAVRAALFAADGKMLVTGSHDGTIRFWDGETGRPLAAIEAPAFVESLALSPDGKTLAAGLADGAVQLHAVADRKLVRRLAGHSGPVRALAFSPDGKRLASGSDDETVRLWDVSGGAEERATLRGHRSAVRRLAFAADGAWLASLGDDESLFVFDPASGRELRKLEGREGEVHALAFSPDGKVLAAGSKGRVVRLFDVAGRAEVRRLDGHAGTVRWLAFVAAGTLVASGSADGSARFWDAASGKLARSVSIAAEAPPGPPGAAAFSPDGARVAAASPPGGGRAVRLYRAGAEPAPARELRDPALEDIGALAFSPDGKILAAADRAIALFDPASGARTALIDAHRFLSVALAFSPDGRLLASSSVDGKDPIRIFEVADRKPLRTLPGHVGTDVPLATPAMTIAFSPDGALLASGGIDRTVRVFAVASGREVARFEGHTEPVNAVAWSPDGKTIASGSSDATVLLWKAPPPP